MSSYPSVTDDIVCDCECHHPIGYRLKPGQTPPPIMRPCSQCKDRAHGYPSVTDHE